MDTQPPLPPNLSSLPPDLRQDDEKTSFAVPGSADKSVAKPAHKASRIILLLLLLVVLLVAAVGVYALAKRFSIEQVYRWLRVDQAPVQQAEVVITPSSAVEPTLTPGDSVSDIEADLNATSLSDFDQEASSVKQDVDAQQ